VQWKKRKIGGGLEVGGSGMLPAKIIIDRRDAVQKIRLCTPARVYILVYEPI
jgi:hypothetical protein